ncbi:hypothetical protein K443DRAFT_13403 [Laccaria amethystina LaAM-08-1]|uniref:CxC5 like cysteine cluster associated with KDZ domain-containing protein n=1 Tax=Laccaria amethystina LaAM-08-1 TaxID=1095629 RepID=A0A0C9X8M3_9AGAR|nr:hypothetical protein K443DRAFT_13403 [Laccaria amethystina LaAM-08-1]
MFLPEFIIILLSDLCEINEESTYALWLYLKDMVWEYADKANIVDERFKLFGRDLGYASLYPPVKYCTNDLCDRRMKGLKLQKTDQTHGILYTLDKGIWVSDSLLS